MAFFAARSLAEQSLGFLSAVVRDGHWVQVDLAVFFFSAGFPPQLGGTFRSAAGRFE
jgi:hypothetical protein